MKKFFVLFIVLTLLITPAVQVSAAWETGTVGESVKWVYDGYGLLTIKGTGAMEDYEYGDAPWQKYKGEIKNVVIEEGITYIGANSFNLADNSYIHTDIESISIPVSVTAIHKDAFKGTAVSGISVHKDNLSYTCENGVLFNKDKTELIIFPASDLIYAYTVPESVTKIANEAFRFNPNIIELTILDNVTEIGESVLYDFGSRKTKIVLNDESYAETYFADKFATMEVLGKDVVSAGAIYYSSSTTGSRVKYYLTESGDLKIYGTGSSAAVSFEKKDVPWKDYISLVKNVVIDEGIETISAYSFKSSPNLESISIPSTLSGFGANTTYDCPSLKTFTVAEGNGFYFVWDGVLYAQNGGIYGCIRYPEAKEGTYYKVRDGISRIADGCFYNCDDLVTVDLPKRLGTGGVKVANFTTCDSIEAINVVEDGLDFYSRDGVVYNARTDELVIYPNNKKDEVFNILTGTPGIFASAFTGAKNLREVVFPASLTKIGAVAFGNCTALEKVTIPATVTEIGSSAFNGCKSLKNLTFEEGTNALKIGGSAFIYCDGLEEVTIPKRATLSGEMTFEKCLGLKKVTIEDGVASIPKRAFRECASLETAVIPGSVETIGEQAFYKCDKLKNITLENGIKTIGNASFAWCAELPEVTIPDSVTTVENEAFFNCTALEDFTLSAGMSRISNSMFAGTSIKNVVIPENIKTVSDFAFKGTLIETITIPETVTYLGGAAFEDCVNLKSVNIEAELSRIYYKTFKNCSALTDIVLPDTVTAVDNEAFLGCTSLTKISVADSMTTIGASAFEGCTNLAEFGIIGGTSMENFVLPAELISLGERAFAGIDGIKKITIPAKLTTFDASAFADCDGLREVTLENGVSTIKNTFAGCENILYIYMPDSVSSITGDVNLVPDSSDTTIVGKEYSYVYYHANRKGLKFSKPMKITSVIPENTFEGTAGAILTGYDKNGCVIYTRVLGVNENTTDINEIIPAKDVTEVKVMIWENIESARPITQLKPNCEV